MNRFLGMPEIASAHGASLDHVNSLVHILMFILFVAWAALFIYILFRFSKKRNPVADYEGVKSHMSSYAEAAVAIVEIVLLIFFSIPLYSDRVDDVPQESEATVVRVVGQQFAWNIHYPGPDGVFGASDVALVDETDNPLGLDPDDPAGADDITTINQFHMPVDKPVLIYLTSKDVIHSFFINEMRVKQDAIPGMMFPVWFEPTVTSEEMAQRYIEQGKIESADDWSYEVGCAQLCGLGHYRMRGFATVHTQESYDAWMAERQAEKAAEGETDDFWG